MDWIFMPIFTKDRQREVRLRDLQTREDYERNQAQIRQLKDMGFGLSQSVMGDVLHSEPNFDAAIDRIIEMNARNLTSPTRPAQPPAISPEQEAQHRLDREAKAAAQLISDRENSERLFMEQQQLMASKIAEELVQGQENIQKQLEQIEAEERKKVEIAEQQLLVFYSQSTLVPSLVDLGKGLQNLPGENNCFLNVVIQSLYALPYFTSNIQQTNEHFHDNAYCTFCALKIIFDNFEFGAAKQIPPTLLREAMAGLYIKEEKFQMGKYADAAVGQPRSELPKCPFNGQECFVHKNMSLTVSQELHCELCSKSTRQLQFSEFVHFVSTDALVNNAKENPSYTMGQAIAATDADYRACETEGCKGSDLPLLKSTCAAPKILAVGLIWTTDKAEPAFIRKLCEVIDKPLNLSEMFSSAPDQRYVLRSVVCYYGLHYLTHIRNPQSQEWITFDDAHVRKISRAWSSVTEKCVSGRYQPAILIYEAC